jgi:uncharacterized protein (DUF1810 family)
MDQSRLERFREAQNSSYVGFESALEELRTGGKRGHWIWYVFPQIDGLGTSGPSQMFALNGEEEAAEFLRDSELRSRLLTIANVVAEELGTGRAKSLRALMGSDIDARKVVSSLTLFRYVAKKLHEVEGTDACGSIAKVADEVLAAAASQGYPPCSYTLRRLRGGHDSLGDSAT